MRKRQYMLKRKREVIVYYFDLWSFLFFVERQQYEKDNLAAGYHNDKKDKETRLQKVSYDASEAISIKRDEHLQKE